MNQEEVMALMKAFGAAYVAGDADRVAECLADDFVWNLPTGEGDPQGQVVRGREAARTFLRERFAQKETGPVFSDGTLEIVGALVLQRYRVRGTARDGSKIDAMGFDLYQVSAGKIRSKDAYWKQISWPTA